MSANRIAVAGALCVLSLVITGWLLPLATAADPETPPPPTSQLRPIDDDLIELEAARIDYQAVFTAGMSGGSPAPTNRLKQILADRSVAKISTYLLQMPPAEASARAQRLFDRFLRAHKAGLEQCMARLRGEESSKGMIPISDNAHALSASLFLCALHCDRETFLKKLDAWQSTIGPLVAECERNPILALFRMQTSMDGLPQQVLILNLYVIVLERDAKLDVAAIQRHCGRRLPEFRSANVSFWDAEKNWFDYAHTPGSKLRDYRNIMTTVNVAQNWSLPIMVDGDAKADAILAAVRTLVDNIGKPGF